MAEAVVMRDDQVLGVFSVTEETTELGNWLKVFPPGGKHRVTIHRWPGKILALYFHKTKTTVLFRTQGLS